MLSIRPIESSSSSASAYSTPQCSPRKPTAGRPGIATTAAAATTATATATATAPPSAAPDAHTLDILTQEMERLVIEARIKNAGGESELGRAQREVVSRAKADFARARPWRRRMLSSGASFTLGRAAQAEVIDVDALDGVGGEKAEAEVETEATKERVEEGRKVNGVWGCLALPPQVREKTPTLVRKRSMPGEFHRARSQSC
ncbi:hypothetical protein OF83DRAFT_144752 [Amylostereum chailletii]|nr:hypothetical protein OF83DRAFT_144752 [Amylostereum chailletii]